MKIKLTIFFIVLLFEFSLKAQDKFISMSAKGKYLNDRLKEHPDGILILSIKKDKDYYYPDCFIFEKNSLKKFIHLDFVPEPASNFSPFKYPYTITTLRWKYSEDADWDFDFDPTKTYYINAFIDSSVPEKKRFLYYFFSEKSWPEIYSELGITQNDFLNNKNEAVKKIKQFLAAAKDAGNFNPIPPKLVP